MKVNKKFGGALIAIAVTGAMIPAIAFSAGNGVRNIKLAINGEEILNEKFEISDEQKAEMKAKLAERLAQQVADGKITQEQADEILANFGEGNMMFKGGRGGMRMEAGERVELTDEQKAEMEAKKAERLAEMKEKLAQDLADGKITQEQYDEMIARCEEGGLMLKGARCGMGMMFGERVERPEMTDEQKAEMKANLIEKFNQAVADGKMTQEEAAEAIANIESGKPVAIAGERGGKMRIRTGDGELPELPELPELAEGQTFSMKFRFNGEERAELTDEQKAEMEAKKAERLAEMKEKLAQDLADGKITQEQYDEMIARCEEGGMMARGGKSGMGGKTTMRGPEAGFGNARQQRVAGESVSF